MTHYDAIVIGSGIGGLSAASLLTQLAGKRVLVLERHFKLGGFNHAFIRKGYHWDVGLHYVGDMAPRSQSRRVLDLITGPKLQWERMPEVFDTFHYPGFEVGQPSDPAAYQRLLTERFPEEALSIACYFADVRRLTAWFAREVASWSMPAPVRAAIALINAPLRRTALSTTREYFQRHFSDPRLRAVLASQWGDYALPPSRSAFVMHCVIVAHYLHGAWYPTGGSDVMTDEICSIITAGGGACLVNHEVEEILVEGGKVTGVRATANKGGKHAAQVDFRAPIVISDAGARNTYQRLLAPDLVPQQLANKLIHAERGVASVTAYVGLKDSPAKLGFTGGNHWYFDTLDHDKTWYTSSRVLEGRAGSAYLSFPAMKDSRATKHTAEIITFIDPFHFDEWRDTSWMRRGEKYDRLKETIATALVDLVERHHPGFADLVDHVEVSTPVTVEEFAAYDSGSFGDLACTPARFMDRLVPARGPVRGLYLTGADACSLGIVGAAMGGVFCAGAVMGPLGIPTIFRRAMS